jgi:hypothetical protein
MERKIQPRTALYDGETDEMKKLKPIKAGMILECTPQGPDAKIYPHVLKTLCPGMEVEKPETMTNKKNLIELGSEVAEMLLQTGCDVVFLIWDRMPKWGGTGKCADGEGELTKALTALGVDLGRIVFCCIDEELESWIISDARAVEEFVWQQTKPHRQPKFKSPGPAKPKDQLKRYWTPFNDFLHSWPIVQAMPDFDIAAKGSKSFADFCAAVGRWCA